MALQLKKTILLLAVCGMCQVSVAQSKDFDLTKNVDIFFAAFRELRNLYVDSLSAETLVKTAIDGMTQNLDPYTEFVPEEDQGDFDFMTTGRYAGIGAYIQKNGEYVRISGPHQGFPAAKAGLVAGDVLVNINGENVKGLSVEKVSAMLKGPVKTPVTIQAVKLRGGDTVTLHLTRESIRLSSIEYAGMQLNGVGYIRLTSFTEGCSKDFVVALNAMKGTGELKSLVVDLRNNGGGLLSEAVKIANIFIPKGVDVLDVRGRGKDGTITYTTSEKPIEPDLPLVVLVNSGTASASEIVSGTMQDLDRGVVLGTRTFGKGLVQTPRPLGYNAQIKLTTAKYYIPSGRCVQAHNFSKRNSDGSVAFIPDSLKKEFKTKNGRKVYDGGGVAPDVKVESDEYKPITISLLSKNLLFDYSLEFYKKNLSIAPPDKFALTDAGYQDFVDFLATKEYDYQTNSERLFKQLAQAVKLENYETEAKDELAALGEKLKHDKNKDLRLSRTELQSLLEEEIVGRYYFDAGRVQSILRTDKQMSQAAKLLQDTVKYNQLLNKSRVSELAGH